MKGWYYSEAWAIKGIFLNPISVPGYDGSFYKVKESIHSNDDNEKEIFHNKYRHFYLKPIPATEEQINEWKTKYALSLL